MDEDGDTLTYTSFAGAPRSPRRPKWQSRTQVTTDTLSFSIRATTMLTAAASDGYGGIWSPVPSANFTGHLPSRPVKSPRVPPRALRSATRSPARPTTTVTTETDDALTYTLTGEAATSGAFVIDAASGQISVAEGATLDYEAKSSYTGEVNWTVQGQAGCRQPHD